jgi:primosomal protein N'
MSPSLLSSHSLPQPAQSQSLASSPAPPSSGENAPYALVALDRTQSSIDRELTYSVPDEFRDMLRIGVAVLVPVARQYVTGYVTGFTKTLDFEPKQLRPISRLLSRVPLFDGKALQVSRWMSAYYHCALSDCLCCYVPQGSQQATEKRYVFAAEDWEAAMRPLSRAPRQLQIAQLLLKSEKALSHKEIQKAVAGADVRDALKRLVEDGTWPKKTNCSTRP